MLGQAVLSTYTNKPSRGFSVTSESPCPYETYIHANRLDTGLEQRDPLELARMDDGLWQEKQVISQLRKAGFKLEYVTPQQMTVHVGKARIPGHPDGIIYITKRAGLEIKAMSLSRYTTFKQKGIAAFKRINCQIQAYMHSEEWRSLDIDETFVYVKHKDTCRPYDVPVPYNPDFITPIIEMADRIVLEGYIPTPEWVPDLCPACDHKMFCWKSDFLDMSGLAPTISLPEAVANWKQGSLYVDYGKYLVDEARRIFKEHLGERDSIIIDDLKVQKVISRRFSISTSKFVQVFGAERLSEVGEEKDVEQMRVTELTKD